MAEQISHESALFLDRFDASRTAPTVDLDDLFFDPFLALDPAGVHTLSPAVLSRVLPARREMFAKAGVTTVSRRSATESWIDDVHRLVTVEWNAERAEAAAITLKSTFVLRREQGRLRVVVYLNHDDVQALLAEPKSQ
jgi:hypothetical protein